MTPPLIAVLNGPNLNLLGLREPALYGRATLDDVEQICVQAAERLDVAIDFRQTNTEGELISWVQECRGRARGILINPAGYGHTSVALLDALLAVGLPTVEVHVTNIHRREDFRQRSLVSQAATGVICGLGVRGYALGLNALADIIMDEDER
ncbi:MAG: type II 3-dehydroquinate dehydratase [Gluconacetobacter diazotrophicus]|nr:type II 3-dehydroquinate dehydratase [Gluconacetobacter diazotrophicus]